MSDNESPKVKSGSGWTDKERLTYLFALIEHSSVKFDHNATPRPEGRSVIACQRMIDRLRTSFKNEPDALVGGMPKSTPRKRKAKGAEEGNGDAEATPTKRGRKKKEVVVESVEHEEEDSRVKVKPEAEDEDEV